MRHMYRLVLVLVLAFTFMTGTAKSQEGFGVQLSKLGSPVVEVGGFMNYSIVVFVTSITVNTCVDGFFEDCEVTLTDQLPAGFVPDVGNITANKFFPLSAPEDISGNCSVTPGNLLTCDLAVPGLFDLAPLASGQFIEINIPGTAPLTEGPIVNTATVEVSGPSFPFTGPLDGTATDSFETEVIGPGPQADLFIFKTDAPDPVIGEAGNTITYTLAVGNAGPDDATNVVVQDLLPAGTTFISSMPGNPPCVFNGGLNALQCSFPAGLPAGNIEFITIEVEPPVLSIGDPDISLLNIARVFADQADPSPGNNIVAEPTTVVAPGLNVTESDLVVTKTSPGVVEQGVEFEYVVNIFNAGPDDADNVIFRDAPFAGTTINLAGIQTTDGPPNCMFLPAAPNFRCLIPNTIPAGQSVSFIIPATYNGPLPLNPTPIFNVANAILGDSNADDTIQEDPVPSNSTFVDVTNVIPEGLPDREVDLVLTKTSPDNIPTDETFQYTIDVLVGGPDDADGLRIRDTYSFNIDVSNFLVFVNGMPAPINCTDFPAANFFRCDIAGTLSQGDQVRIQFDADYVGPPVVLPFEPFPIFNHAQAILFNEPATFNWIDPTPENNIDVSITNLFNPVVPPTVSDLVLTKSVPDIIIPGTLPPDPTNTFGYSIEVVNLGPDEAINVVVRDIIPDDVTFLTFTPGCNIMMNPLSMRDELVCSVGNIAPGDIARVDIRAVYTGVAPQFPNFRAVFNTATATFGLRGPFQIDPDTNNNTDVGFSRALVPQEIILADLDVRKSAPAIIIENQEFSYFVEVTNLGPNTAPGVVLRDLIPADISINPANLGGQGCAPAGDEIICAIGDMMNGDTVRFEFLATFIGDAPPLPGSVPVFNLAQVGFAEIIIPGNPDTVILDLNPANNAASAISQAIEPPPNINLVDLFVVKVDSPDPVVTEETLSYSIFVYNFGPEDAVDVTVTDILPEGVMVTNDGGCDQMGQVLTCDVPLIEAGTASIIQIEVTAPELMDDQPIMILNGVRADVDPFALLIEQNTIQLDFAPSNNTDYEKTTVVPVPPPVSDLLILKSDTPDPVIEGNELTYTIFVKNGGPDDAFGVEIRDWLPTEGLLLDTVEFSLSNVDVCEQNPMGEGENIVRCFIEVLAADQSATVTITVQTDELPPNLDFLTIFNVAKVESIGFEMQPPSADPNPLNNVVIESTLIGEFVPVADLFIIKSDSPDPVQVNQLLTYSLFVSNSGPDPATNVVVTDTLPSSVDFISATPDQGTCGGPIGDVITCNLGNLDVGVFTEVTIVVRPTQAGSILNVGQVMADEHDPKSSNNISPQVTTVNPTVPDIPDDVEPSGNDLFLLKFVSPNPAEVGDEVLFTIIVGNNGEFASGATVVDDLPVGVTFISATASTGDQCDITGFDVICDIASIAPLGQGEAVVIEVLVRADRTGSLPNIAFLENVPNDPNTTNNFSIVALNVVSDGGTPDPDPVDPDPVDPDPVDPGTGGGGNGSSNGNCALASGPTNTSSTAVNFALMLLPLLVFGIRSIRRKK